MKKPLSLVGIRGTQLPNDKSGRHGISTVRRQLDDERPASSILCRECQDW
jgi:hypothetical protein